MRTSPLAVIATVCDDPAAMWLKNAEHLASVALTRSPPEWASWALLLQPQTNRFVSGRGGGSAPGVRARPSGGAARFDASISIEDSARLSEGGTGDVAKVIFSNWVVCRMGRDEFRF